MYGYRETLPPGDPFPTNVTWYVDATKTKKVMDIHITRNPNKTPSQIKIDYYKEDGATIASTQIDTITYSGIFEISRTQVTS